MIDLSTLVSALLALAAAAVSAAVPILVPALLTRLRIANNADLSAKVVTACNAAAGAAYRVALAHEGGLASVAVHNLALAQGLKYVLASVPETLTQLGLTPEHVQAMVAARLGVLLAQDATVSAGQPVPQAGPVPPVPAVPLLAPTVAPGAGPAPLVALALLLATGLGVVACGPQVLTPAAQLYAVETGFDVGLKQATLYATLPRCAATVAPPCSDAAVVSALVARANVASDAIRLAHGALAGQTGGMDPATAVGLADATQRAFVALLPAKVPSESEPVR